VTRPRVGISRCLLGDPVRYDGTHRLDARITELLGPLVEWVAVCPEVEVGMGTPREPIQLVASADGVPSGDRLVRLRGVRSGEDWTERMAEWARRRVPELAALDLSGYVFKAGSPSCGIDDAAIDAVDGERLGSGLFAQALIDALPDLPVIDEKSLGDATRRAQFLEQVLRHQGRLSSG
jgi:uncharacterized protein YbbK (DUF523 family)